MARLKQKLGWGREKQVVGKIIKLDLKAEKCKSINT
jgi:hypothetical protein